MRIRYVPPLQNNGGGSVNTDVNTDVNSWSHYLDHWDVEPIQISTTSSGTVFGYTLGGVTRYRLIPNPYDATQDAFYSDWDGTALSGLIITRGGA